MVSVKTRTRKKKHFQKSNKRQNLTIPTPESAFALNYFINNALCNMEMFLFFFFFKVLYFKESCKIEDLFVCLKRTKSGKKKKMNLRLGVK